MSETITIGVIGGSGLYQMPGIEDVETRRVATPYGETSADIVIGTLRGKRVAFLPRHGAGHVLSPTTVPYRANIYALKSLGVRFIIAVNAVGSLREDYAPGHIVIPDQLYDNTKANRGRSFFESESGLVAHVGVADPFSPELSDVMVHAVSKAGGTVHQGGTLIIIEGPRFSTRGESKIFRQWGCSLIGMTTTPEAFLAREAEIAYATMAHVTDYDVWHTDPVTTEMVAQTFHHNLQVAQQAVANTIEALDTSAVWPAHTALDGAIMTASNSLSSEAIAKLGPLVARVYANRSA
jgi:5'-methylthioadenosine phosphorylase